MRSQLFKTTLCITVAMANFACGSKVKSEASGGDTSEESVAASLTVSTVDLDGLALLATTTSFSGSIASCLTGRTSTFDQSSTSVTLLVGDSGCYARLNTINVTFGDGTSAAYAPDSAYKFVAGTAVE